MTVNSSSLELYHLTLQRQSNYIHSCVGHFVDLPGSTSGKRKSRKDYQVCIATETHLELYDVEEGSFQRLAVVPIFATITAMQSLPVETNYSYLVVVTDAGNLSLLQFVNKSNAIRLHSLFNEPFARSGLRRVAPQKYIEVDPQGRCIFISATERNKLCYQTDSRNNTLNVSSPLEFQKSNRITISTTVCDVAFDNPIYASLEIDSTDGSKYLAFYMLDLGLNHVVQQSESLLPSDANYIVAVPNLERYGIKTKLPQDESQVDDAINSFVIVALEGKLVLKDARGYFNLEVCLPTRNGASLSIISAAVHKLKKEFFMLLQCNNGDLYKAKILPNEATDLTPKLTLGFFDSIAPSSRLHIFRNGLLLSLQELAGYSLYEFESLGDDENILTSDEPDKQLKISPPSQLENLSLLHESKSLNPTLTMEVDNSTPLTLMAHSKNALQNLSSGVSFSELITSPLPPKASGVWSIRLPRDPWHRLILLALPKTTMILKIEEGTLEELEQSNNKFKIDGDTTVFAGLMGKRSIVQVCENSMLQIEYDLESTKMNVKSEWFPPAGIKILKATSSFSQLALALSNNEVVYFELDTSSSAETLNEYQERIELSDKITDLSLPNVFRSDFLAVGCQDSSVKIFGLKAANNDTFLDMLSMQVLLSPPSSVRLMFSKNDLLLHVGLDSGVYIRSSIDKVDGQLFDLRTKYLGTKPVRISILMHVNHELSSDGEEEEDGEDDNDEEKVPVEQSSCAILHCDKTWISYEADQNFYVRPLILSNKMSLDAIADFRTSDLKSNGCCALSSRGTLIIGRFDKFTKYNEWFQQDEALSNEEDENMFTDFRGRKIVADTFDQKLRYVVENNVTKGCCRISACRSGSFLDMNAEDSKFFIVDDICLDAQVARFGTNDTFLMLSTSSSRLKTLLMKRGAKDNKNTLTIQLVHDTTLEETVHSMASFGDKLVASLSSSIVLFGMGRKQLLKKSVTAMPPSISKVVRLCQWGNERVAIGDIQESVTLFVFDKQLNQFMALADDVVKRHVTALEFLDKSTVVGGDRFGNIWVLRVPQHIEKMINEEYSYFVSKYQKAGSHELPRNIMECPCKWEVANHFYANDIPVSFQVVESLDMSDRTCVIYAGLQGTIACLVPLLTKNEIDFFHKLEDCLNDADETFFIDNETEMAAIENDFRDELGGEVRTNTKAKRSSPRPMIEGAFSLVGREHIMYRSYYAPVKGVVDGDFCESFSTLYPSEQELLVSKMTVRNAKQVQSRLAVMRTNYL
ncbi:LAME_0D04698g1_1 [Lachancea meyersii CBS 8951]|uniref:LAME_0D04698g1_1 n=1 Tax=Lachancea meyersii CBS 8951 TaxID=1266667 RepID=A0A1G4J864_9SACH|nr:LAME_0D04698g1_1 [Lachancea meyersii CBS 8951]